MSSVEFSVVENSTIIGLTFKELKEKYNVGIFSFKTKKGRAPILARDDSKIKSGFIIKACGKKACIEKLFVDGSGCTIIRK